MIIGSKKYEIAIACNLLPSVVALCLLIAVQRSNAQAPIVDVGTSSGELTEVSAKPENIIDPKIPISVFDIVGLNVEQKSNGYLMQIHCTKELPDFESWLKPMGENTALYITLADAKADVVALQDFKPTAFVKKFLIFQSATSVQLTFIFKGRVNSVDLIPVGESHNILVAVFTPPEEQLSIRKVQ